MQLRRSRSKARSRSSCRRKDHWPFALYFATRHSVGLRVLPGRSTFPAPAALPSWRVRVRAISPSPIRGGVAIASKMMSRSAPTGNSIVRLSALLRSAFAHFAFSSHFLVQTDACARLSVPPYRRPPNAVRSPLATLARRRIQSRRSRRLPRTLPYHVASPRPSLNILSSSPPLPQRRRLSRKPPSSPPRRCSRGRRFRCSSPFPLLLRRFFCLPLRRLLPSLSPLLADCCSRSPCRSQTPRSGASSCRIFPSLATL